MVFGVVVGGGRAQSAAIQIALIYLLSALIILLLDTGIEKSETACESRRHSRNRSIFQILKLKKFFFPQPMTQTMSTIYLSLFDSSRELPPKHKQRIASLTKAVAHSLLLIQERVSHWLVVFI
jgi:hypothetical protein